MKITETILPGVLLIESSVYTDDRGFFLESNRAERYGIGPFVQDNHSRSKKGVLRGLHYQGGQGKLVRVSHGTIFDVAVDIRRDSPFFGDWFGAELNDRNHLQMYIPPDLLMGFVF